MGSLTVRYTGPAALVGLLAQHLREEGAEVSYDPPAEDRGVGEIAETVVVSLVCSGLYDAIKAGVTRFGSGPPGQRADVDLPERDEEDQ